MVSSATLALLDEPTVNRNWVRDRHLSVSEWADRHRVLDPLFSNEHGPWRTARVPHAREWMDSAAQPWVRQITIVGGTQVGKSEAMNNVVGYYVHHRPSPTMFVLPSEKLCRMAAERRILPMIRSSPALAAELTERKRDAKTLEIALRRSVIYLRSAQSPGSLASVPVRLVIGDETEKWPIWSGDEASPLALVRERTRTFWDHVVMLACTPKLRGGLIDREFRAGDQRRFHVECPHCHAWQPFEWHHVQWDREKIRTADEMRRARQAYYRCPHCRGAIDDHQKHVALQRGVWVPAGRDPVAWIAGEGQTDRAEHRSYHIWAAYSPWLTWWKIVVEWLRSKDEPQELMNFTNSWLAEVWEERVESLGDEAVTACVEARSAGVVPEEALVLTAAVDVQKDRLEWCLSAWGLDEESWVVDAGRIPLMPRGEDWHQLAETLFSPKWGKLQVRCVVVDYRGGRGDEVLDFARRHQPVVRMIAGVERDGPDVFAARKIERHPRTGAPLPSSLTLWSVTVGWFKDLVAARLRKAVDAQSTPAGRVHLPNGLPEGWLHQLCSEHKVLERAGKKARERWVLRPGVKRNEAWDLLVYNAAAARMIHVHRLTSDRRPGVAAAAAAPAKPQKPVHRGLRRGLADRFPMHGGGG